MRTAARISSSETRNDLVDVLRNVLKVDLADGLRTQSVRQCAAHLFSWKFHDVARTETPLRIIRELRFDANNIDLWIRKLQILRRLR